MAEDFLAGLLGNNARARLLRLFTLAPTETLTLSAITKRSGVSASSATAELRNLEKLGVLKSVKTHGAAPRGKKKSKARSKTIKGKEIKWLLNPEFKYMRALSAFIHEVAPMQYKNILEVLRRSGGLAAVILSGSFMGDLSRPADIIVVADPLRENRIEAAIRVLEPRLGREIRYAAFSTPEFRYRLTIQDRLIRDTMDYPHFVLWDKERLFRGSK